MSKQQKYYAIKVGKGVKDKIVRTWAECEQLVKGEEEALEYLKAIKNVNKKLEDNKKAMEHNKAKKKGTVSVANVFTGVRIDKKIVEEFESKCNDLNVSKEKILIELIREWVE